MAERKPSWLRIAAPAAQPYRATAAAIAAGDLHTVCSEARCPNKSECFSAGTATFLILGQSCTRDCGFCAVGHSLPGPAFADDEPRRVAVAARRLGLKHVVVTSVTRDDLGDGGAACFAATIRALRAAVPAATVEVLVPDMAGSDAALQVVLAERPDVLAHNLETVPRLHALVRPAAAYGRSLELLVRAVAHARSAAPPAAPACAPAAARAPRLMVKTGLMVGLGETDAEVDAVLGDCAATGVDAVTIGQYLQPRADCLPVVRYVHPERFAAWERCGEQLGLRVLAGPLVRSSYKAGELLAGRGGPPA